MIDTHTNQSSEETQLVRRLLMLAYYFPPENASGAMRPSRFAKYLPQFGYSVRVISLAGSAEAPPKEEVSRVPARGEVRPWASRASWALGALERACLPYNECLPWVPHAISEAGRIHDDWKFSTVLSTSPPVATHLAALWIKHRHGVKWVADFRDPLRGNPFRNRSIGRPYDAALERCIFWNADALIANTDVAAEGWIKRYPWCRDKISVIWNGFDPEESVNPMPAPPHEYKLILHAGAFYGGRTPKLLLASIGRLLSQNRLEADAVRIELLGNVEEAILAPFQDLVQRRCLVYSGSVSREDARAQIAAADFLLLVDMNELNMGVQVPAKLFDYIRVGRPILTITTRNSPTERILAGSGVPYVCLYPDEPPERSDEKVISFLKQPTEPTEPSPWFWKEFDGRAQTQKLSEIIDAVHGLDHFSRETSSLPVPN